MNFLWALGASIVISLISFVGAISLVLKEESLHKVLLLLISFSAGALIGGAFLHLIPEAAHKSAHGAEVYLLVIVGFIFFFILERYLHWRHCHKGACAIHAFTYLNLVGDGAHNFIDGLIIGSSFTVSVPFGLAAAFAIIMHEIPQEIGDFGVLIYGGMSRGKALFCNFLSALTAVAGTVIGYALAHSSDVFLRLLMPAAAGGFIYIASCDLIPELHKQQDLKKATLSMGVFILGVALMYFASKGPH